MSGQSFVDPRIRMRDALRQVVARDPAGWDQPSLAVFRNRLLDETGSDARPLAELLVEALRRGWRERLPRTATESSRWDAIVAPFILQWSAERFVQPDMARWAVECWGYAMRVIDDSQVRIAPAPRREPISAFASRLNAGAKIAGMQAARAVVQPRSATPARSAGSSTSGSSTSGNRAVGIGATAMPRTATGYIPAARSGVITKARGARPLPSARGATAVARPTPYRSSGSAGATISPWVARGMIGILAAMGLAVVVRVSLSGGGSQSGQVSGTGASTRANASAIVPSRMDSSGPGVSAGAVLGAANPLSPDAGATVSPALTGGVTIIRPANPGVPSLTRELLPTGDRTRMLYVEPARRATGNSRPVTAPTASPAPTTYDEIRLEDGTVMRGRTEVVRSGTVIFRDMRTGLRHEVPKDDVREILTEFGTLVRFRGTKAQETSTAGRQSIGAGTARAAAARAAERERGVRAKGVGGVYAIRYSAANAVGSPECTSLWTRSSSATDRAVVVHKPGADTMSLAFENGDNFPSNIDADGFFASTFRIVPDQARTSTALITRLTGRFQPRGALALTVNIVFYRRMRSGGDLTCNVTVNAEGRREE